MRKLRNDPEILKIYDLLVAPALKSMPEGEHSPMSYLANHFGVDERPLKFYNVIKPITIKARLCPNGYISDPTLLPVEIFGQILVDESPSQDVRLQYDDDVYLITRLVWRELKDHIHACSNRHRN